VGAKLHNFEPFCELQFVDSASPLRLTYTLFFEGQTHLSSLGIKGVRLHVAYHPSGCAATFSGEGTAEYNDHSISFSSGKVTMDGTKLPLRPPFSVISRSGKIKVGEWIRTFD